MKLIEVRDRARAAGVKQAAKMKKAELIRTVQRTEGNPACFGADWRFDCPQLQCCWREDCLTPNPG